MIGTIVQPMIWLLVAILVVAVLVFVILRSRKKKEPQSKEVLETPVLTQDPIRALEDSLEAMQAYKTNLKKYGRPYLIETTPFVIEQLKAGEQAIQSTARVAREVKQLLSDNYEKLTALHQSQEIDEKKLEFDVMNHVNKTIIVWRNWLKEKDRPL